MSPDKSFWEQLQKESFIGRTGQVWKLGTSFAVTALSAVVIAVVVIAWSSSSARPERLKALVVPIGATLLGIGASAWSCLAIRCPKCGFRFLWKSVSTESSDLWLLAVISLTRCEECSFDGLESYTTSTGCKSK